MSVSPSVDRPDDLFARSREWSDLSAFATADTPGLRIGIVSGRRRQGKSFLLRRLVNARAGLHEVERAQALARFADDVADHLELPPGTLRFADWEDALRLALGQPRDRAGTPRGRAASIVVLDEFPYLLALSPELPRAKSTNSPRVVADLARLDAIRQPHRARLRRGRRAAGRVRAQRVRRRSRPGRRDPLGRAPGGSRCALRRVTHAGAPVV